METPAAAWERLLAGVDTDVDGTTRAIALGRCKAALSSDSVSEREQAVIVAARIGGADRRVEPHGVRESHRTQGARVRSTGRAARAARRALRPRRAAPGQLAAGAVQPAPRPWVAPARVPGASVMPPQLRACCRGAKLWLVITTVVG